MTSNFPIGPLTAIAIADAYGCGFEFLPAFDKRWPQMQYKQHTMWPGLLAGHYSDDTQLTLAVAEWMLHGPQDRLYVGLQDWLVKAYERDIRGGSPRMEDALHEVISDGGYLSNVLTEKTDGSGAAMRASLFGYGPNEAHVVKAAGKQAELTHVGDGVLSAQAAALLVFYLANGYDKYTLGERVAKVLEDGRFAVTEKPTKRSHKGIDCVLAAIWILQKSESLSEILQHVIAMGGDTDTVAVMAMGAAWMNPNYAHDLPQHLWWELENGPYGKSYLRKVELELMERELVFRSVGIRKMRLRTK